MNISKSSSIGVAFAMESYAFDAVFGPEFLKRISRLATLAHEPVTAAQLASGENSWTRDVEVLFTSWGGPVLDAELLKRFPRLRLILHGAGTVRRYVTDAFWQRGIQISTGASANAIPVSEYTFGAILLSLKRVWHLNRTMTQLLAAPSPLPYLPGGYGSTVGLISLGWIGSRVAEMLQALDVRVIGYDPYLPPERFDELGVEPVDLPSVFSQSDVVSLHTPLMSATRGMIDGTLLRLMRPGATFINTARGAVVNESDLIVALQARPDLQAILDITDPEPPVPDSPLYSLPNCFLTPHIAGSIGPECRRIGEMMLQELQRYLQGQPLRYAIDQEQSALLA